jgi:hypothetical protein
MHELLHRVVVDPYEVNIDAAVLWETIAVEKMTLLVGDESAGQLSTKLIKKELESSLEGEVSLSISSASLNEYLVETSVPLVVAIRVVKVSYGTSSPPAAILDLSTAATGRPQTGNHGYEVVVEECDPLHDTATLLIKNRSIPKFTDKRNRFIGSESWVNPEAKDAIGSEADYIWDSLWIRWEEDLSRCKLDVTRQEMYLHPTPSGIETF